MSGLEAVEVSFIDVLKNKDFRVDTQFYTTQLKRNSVLQYRKIGDCLTRSQYGISIEMNENGIGYPIYRMNEITNMLCDLYVNKTAQISQEEFETFKLNAGDVLFNRTNSYDFVGRTGVYYPNVQDESKIFASYLVRFVPNSIKINSEYLAAFLSCKYGVQDVKRRARQSINQTNVNPEEVKEIEIPLLCDGLQNKIRKCFQTAHTLRVDADRFYKDAEQLLLSELGLTNFSPSTEPVAVKSFSDSFGTSGRLDAEYYQPKYEDIEKAFDKFDRVALSAIVNYPISSGITPKAGGDDYTDFTNGIPFIRAVDIVGGVVDLKSCNYIKPEIHNGILKRTQLKDDDVLLSIAGTVGRCGIYSNNGDGNINQAVAILRFDETLVKRLYLVVFFNSTIGNQFVSKYARHGVQTNLNLAEVGSLRIPIIDSGKQHKLSKMVQQSFALRRQSEQLLEVAKHAVEMAIEEGECKAIEFIKSNTANLMEV